MKKSAGKCSHTIRYFHQILSSREIPAIFQNWKMASLSRIKQVKAAKLTIFVYIILEGIKNGNEKEVNGFGIGFWKKTSMVCTATFSGNWREKILRIIDAFSE